MTSILTNIGAMSALQTLRSINSSMETTQGRVSSGARVAEASHNAAYWSIATTMRSDNAALSAVSDALGLGAAKVDTAYTGIEAAIDVVETIKKKVAAATEQGVDRTKIQEEITQLQDQLRSITQGSSFSGENWLLFEEEDTSATPPIVADKTVVSGFVRTDNAVQVTTTTHTLISDETDLRDNNVLFAVINDDGTATGGILGTAGDGTEETGLAVSVNELDITELSDEDLALALTLVEKALQTMTSVGAALGSISMRIDLQEEFVNRLSDSIESGIGRLVDADMNEESTRLKALQTQQQLGVQALSIANSNSENILSLFR